MHTVFELNCIVLYSVLYIMASDPPLDNHHIRNMDQPGDISFHKTVVDQVKKARDSVFDDICSKTGVPECADIRFFKCQFSKYINRVATFNFISLNVSF